MARFLDWRMTGANHTPGCKLSEEAVDATAAPLPFARKEPLRERQLATPKHYRHVVNANRSWLPRRLLD